MTKPFEFDELVDAQLTARRYNIEAGMPENAANDLFLRNLSAGMAALRYHTAVEDVPVGPKCVHTEHCCVIHGCKYGADDCPVETKKKRQSRKCETCRMEDGTW